MSRKRLVGQASADDIAGRESTEAASRTTPSGWSPGSRPPGHSPWQGLEYYSRHYGRVSSAWRSQSRMLFSPSTRCSTRKPMPRPRHHQPMPRRTLDSSSDFSHDRDKPAPRPDVEALRGTGVSPAGVRRSWLVRGEAEDLLRVSPLVWARTWRGVARSAMSRDFDQAMFMVGACTKAVGSSVSDTLNNPSFVPAPGDRRHPGLVRSRHGAEMAMKSAAHTAVNSSRPGCPRRRTRRNCVSNSCSSASTKRGNEPWDAAHGRHLESRGVSRSSGTPRSSRGFCSLDRIISLRPVPVNFTGRAGPKPTSPSSASRRWSSLAWRAVSMPCLPRKPSPGWNRSSTRPILSFQREVAGGGNEAALVLLVRRSQAHPPRGRRGHLRVAVRRRPAGPDASPSAVASSTGLSMTCGGSCGRKGVDHPIGLFHPRIS